MRTYLSPASLRALARDLRQAWAVIRDGHHWRTHPPVPPGLQPYAEARERQRLADQRRNAS